MAFLLNNILTNNFCSDGSCTHSAECMLESNTSQPMLIYKTDFYIYVNQAHADMVDLYVDGCQPSLLEKHCLSFNIWRCQFIFYYIPVTCDWSFVPSRAHDSATAFTGTYTNTSLAIIGYYETCNTGYEYNDGTLIVRWFRIRSYRLDYPNNTSDEHNLQYIFHKHYNGYIGNQLWQWYISGWSILQWLTTSWWLPWQLVLLFIFFVNEKVFIIA